MLEQREKREKRLVTSQSGWSTNRKASYDVLSNLCDKIQQVSGLLNPRIIRTFSLECLVTEVDNELEFLPKSQLMAKLEEYDTLINAMGALFYVSKRMVSQIPCCLEAWKAVTFEKRASKIHEMLSTGNPSVTSPKPGSVRDVVSPLHFAK